MTQPTTTLAAIALPWLLAAAAAAAADPETDPAFVIKTRPVVLTAGNSTEVVLVEGTHLEAVPTGTELVVRDLGQGSSAVKVEFTRVQDAFVATEATRYWWVTLEAEGLPAKTELSRAAGISYGRNAGVADYVLTTQTEGNLGWSVTPPKKRLRLQQNREVAFPVKTGDRPVELALAGSSLQDEATVAWLENADLGLRLASAERDDAAPRRVRVALPANSTTNVVLEIAGEPPPGTYVGAVTLTVAGSADTQSFDLEVYSSPATHRWVGALLIFLGIALSFFVTVVARSWARRLQSLRAARLVAAGLEPLRARLGAARATTGHPLSNLSASLDALGEELGRRKLAAGNYLPPLVPVSIAGEDERTEAFKSHLKTLADRARVAEKIVRGGVGAVAERWDRANTDPYSAALDALDALADTATIETVASDVAAVVAGLPPRAEFEAVAAARARATARQLEVRLDYLHGSIWLIWTAVTLAAGIGVLILPNPGFGTPMDLLTCFFWGLGVQTAGDGLRQLTPGSVRSSLELSAPSVDS